MNYPLPVLKSVWRRIKKPRKGSLIVIQGKPFIVTQSHIDYSGPFPVLEIKADAL